MSYQIQYAQTGSARRRAVPKAWIKHLLTIVMVVAVLIAAIWSWGGDWRTTVDALETMALELQQGNGIKESLFSFCVAVLRGAGIE